MHLTNLTGSEYAFTKVLTVEMSAETNPLTTTTTFKQKRKKEKYEEELAKANYVFITFPAHTIW